MSPRLSPIAPAEMPLQIDEVERGGSKIVVIHETERDRGGNDFDQEWFPWIGIGLQVLFRIIGCSSLARARRCLGGPRPMSSPRVPEFRDSECVRSGRNVGSFAEESASFRGSSAHGPVSGWGVTGSRTTGRRRE